MDRTAAEIRVVVTAATAPWLHAESNLDFVYVILKLLVASFALEATLLGLLVRKMESLPLLDGSRCVGVEAAFSMTRLQKG